MFKFNKKYLSKKTKGGAVAFGLSMVTLALFGVTIFDGCVPGNANTTSVSKTPLHRTYAVKEIKGNNQFDTNVASHRPFNWIASKIASHRPQTYGDDSHYGYHSKAVNLGHNTVMLTAGKKYRMSNKQYKKSQASNKSFYNHVMHDQDEDGHPLNQ